MIDNRVYRLKNPFTLMKDMEFKGGEEFHIVNDVVYMQGAMLPPEMQAMFYSWITKNPALFIDDTRNF